MNKNIISLISGLLFAFGLALSGMTEPHIVRGFLDVFGHWNPALLGVMVGAICVHALFYQVIKKRASPILDTEFHLPKKKQIDKRLIVGAICFGLGWGWVGICPGPAIVSLTSGQIPFFYFVASMLVGMKIFQVFFS